ncbi:1-deoxy-D-xylulose-5-phosphate reductoisomerase [Bittarella massiliensis (ex Durand et al. 2017)]|uniref:1-deoxy-D-xylulose 5-phosphate reductoisomerase n=1 Tax=Bittarella massiliensis (ex Durand et al. 2017) TaxID=1720313 RepID=A0AAW5KA17_9FIRM|nr:1-deoxy-D-xylulose-5-phosphate reductoisomerase [Bittarella massiliensis (ex Durand et al. 2017)]MCQ4949058.1 1-deoxy-D-xylulose-5-phosphate reductoisomerase [Bittarella massiliensis (ex Durand et al. 2017)]
MCAKKVTVLGSTGSIGTQALDVIEKNGYEVVGLSANSSVLQLENQVRRFRPPFACMVDERAAHALRDALRDTDTKVLAGVDGLCELAAREEADVVLNSVVGMVGLRPTLAAIETGKPVALANKETLVAGGKLVTEAARAKGVPILPVDSEHSAIFQCLQDRHSARALKKVILTASGGPFFGRSREELEKVSIEDALNHPNWSMGAKITVDSATLMNKGLELIEAAWLFDKTPDEIEIVVHRESVIHSLVEFDDHSVLAQLGVPDMRIPIQYALTYPERLPSPVKELSLTDYPTLHFAKPDIETFTCLKTCIEAARRGGLAPCAISGANEEAVALFLSGKIGFLEIGELVRGAMNTVPRADVYSLEDVLQTDAQARAYVRAQAR